jgi:hypothetical protein
MKRYFFILLLPTAISHSAFAATEKNEAKAPPAIPVQETIPAQDLNKDCGILPNGGSMTGYQTPTAPCIPITITCINGTLTGPPPIMSCIDNPFSNGF